MDNNKIYKLAFKQLCSFCFWVVAARFTSGAALFLMAFLGVVYAFRGKMGRALGIHAMIMFMVVMNPHLLPKYGMLFSLALRGGPLLIGLSLVFKEFGARSRRRLPMGMLLLFLSSVGISSATGWAPMISYFKLLNFTFFFIGIWLGTNGLSRDVEEMFNLRATLFALSVFLVFGSVALYPFPGISTLQGVLAANKIDDIALINEMIMDQMEGGAQSLFCGVTFQSQAFAPLLCVAFAWTLCDLLFVEGRFRWPHCVLLVLALPLFYMSRSRVALLGLVVILMVIYLYLPNKMQLSARVRKWVGKMLSLGGIVLVVAIAIAEIKSDAISRWVRKTDDVNSDRRSLSEAFTASRQGLIEMCMDDFKRNPTFGMGFQVASYTQYYAEGAKGLILSSPIEKGVLPVMIVGESGIIGTILFFLFLFSFYVGCANRQLYLTLSMMTVFLAVNMGEATFFSPGGIGGIEWIFCIVGGYTLDITVLNMKHIMWSSEYESFARNIWNKPD